MAADAAVHLANVSLACGGARGARTCLPLAELTPTLVDAWWRDADTRIFDPRDVRNRRCSNCSAADQSWGLQVAPSALYQCVRLELTSLPVRPSGPTTGNAHAQVM